MSVRPSTPIRTARTARRSRRSARAAFRRARTARQALRPAKTARESLTASGAALGQRRTIAGHGILYTTARRPRSDPGNRARVVTT